MNGEQLYSHYWDATYCESGAGAEGFKLPGWGELEPQEQAGWEQLSRCIKEGKGVTIAWPYEPATAYVQARGDLP